MMGQSIRLSAYLFYIFYLTLIVHHLLLLVVAIPLPHADDDTKSGHLSAKDIGQLTALSPQQHEQQQQQQQQQVKFLENGNVGLNEIDVQPDFQKSMEPPPDESSRYESTSEVSHSLVGVTQQTFALMAEAVSSLEEAAEEAGGAEAATAGGVGGVDLEDDALMENLGTSLDSMKKRLLIDKVPANASPAEPSGEEARELYRVVDHIPQQLHHNQAAHHHRHQQKSPTANDHPPKIKESTPGKSSSGIDEKEWSNKAANPRSSEEAANEEQLLEVNCSTSAESAAPPDAASREAEVPPPHNDSDRTPQPERYTSAEVIAAPAEVPYESIVRSGPPSSIDVDELAVNAAARSSDKMPDDVKGEKSTESPAASNLMIAVVKHHHRANPTAHNDDNDRGRLPASPYEPADRQSLLPTHGQGQAEEFPPDRGQAEEFEEEEEDVTDDADDEKLTLWQKIVLGIRCAKQDCRDTLIARRLAEVEAAHRDVSSDPDNHHQHRRITEWSIMRRMKRRFRKGDDLTAGNSTSDEKLCGCEALKRLSLLKRRHQKKKAAKDSTKMKDLALKKSLEV